MTDIEYQASGYIACFWNSNGNCAVSQLVFYDKPQAQDWARRALEHACCQGVHIDSQGDVRGTAFGLEMGWKIVPVLLAEKTGQALSVENYLSLR